MLCRVDDTVVEEIAKAYLIAGVDWSILRSQQPPIYVSEALTYAGESYDWQLSSLALSQPLRYEYDKGTTLGSVPT